MSVVEKRRVSALHRYDILDTPAEPNFDLITRLAAAIFNKKVCTLSLADKHRHWFKSRVGVGGVEMPRARSFCDVTIQSDHVFVVPDASTDVRFAESPIVAGAPHLRFYAGAPLITPAGERVGSLCVLDTAPDLRFSDLDADILSNLAAAAVELMEARSRQTEIADAAKSIAHQARHDALTGLPNRRLLFEYATREIANACPDDQLAVLFLDLDGFKAVNDRSGHLAGDRLLEVIAARFKAATPRGDLLSRLGGDEFVILRRGSYDLRRSSEELAAYLINCVNEPCMIDGDVFAIGVSIGIAVGAATHASFDKLLNEADKALYHVKYVKRGDAQFAALYSC